MRETFKHFVAPSTPAWAIAEKWTLHNGHLGNIYVINAVNADENHYLVEILLQSRIHPKLLQKISKIAKATNNLIPKFMAARVQRAEFVRGLGNRIETDSTVRDFSHTNSYREQVILILILIRGTQ